MSNIEIPISRNTQVKDLPDEIWVDVINYDGIYSVSNLGRVKSERRFVNNGTSGRWVKERILRQAHLKDGRLSVSFSKNDIAKSANVSVVVFESFNHETSPGRVIMHKNKNSHDNRLVNLEETTCSESHALNFKLGLLPHLEEHHKKMRGSGWHKTTDYMCRQCLKNKTKLDFEKGRCVCTECRGIKYFGRNSYLNSLREKGLKKCTKCKKEKEFSFFHSKTRKCKLCASEDYFIKKQTINSLK